MKIKDLKAIEILDSRGNPTIKTFIELEDGSVHSSSVPSGASIGSHEAVELRDRDPKRYNGVGVLTAVNNINIVIKQALVGMETDPITIDSHLLELDGSPNKAKLGANAILSVSMAAARSAAHSQNKPLWKFINEYFFAGSDPAFPKLMVNIVNGGKHANWNFDIQEFIVVPNETKPSEAVRIASEIFHSLGKLLRERKLSTLVGDEGGYSPELSSNEEILSTIIEAAKNAGYENGKDFRLSLDCAATEWFENGEYLSRKANTKQAAEQLISYYNQLVTNYNLLSVEDAFAEDDWEAFKKFSEETGTIVIGDDLFATNPERIKRGIDEKCASAVIIKPNQIGTIKETIEAVKLAHAAGWKTAISHRSGETEDNFIADLAYACGSEFIKTGSMSRSERLSKYNRLLEIEKGI